MNKLLKLIKSMFEIKGICVEVFVEDVYNSK